MPCRREGCSQPPLRAVPAPGSLTEGNPRQGTGESEGRCPKQKQQGKGLRRCRCSVLPSPALSLPPIPATLPRAFAGGREGLRPVSPFVCRRRSRRPLAPRHGPSSAGPPAPGASPAGGLPVPGSSKFVLTFSLFLPLLDKPDGSRGKCEGRVGALRSGRCAWP